MLGKTIADLEVGDVFEPIRYVPTGLRTRPSASTRPPPDWAGRFARPR
jgi:hypothetical protein